MPKGGVRELREGDTEALLADLRPADRDECDALLGPGQEQAALAKSIAQSALVWTFTIDDRVAGIFGVTPVSLLGGQGLPWMLGTPAIDRHPSAFIRLNRPYIARMLALCPHLVNVVDARNVRSIAWLKKMGFTVLPAQPMGVAGLPFHPFFMNA
jgi:hypothetical protein